MARKMSYDVFKALRRLKEDGGSSCAKIKNHLVKNSAFNGTIEDVRSYLNGATDRGTLIRNGNKYLIASEVNNKGKQSAAKPKKAAKKTSLKTPLIQDKEKKKKPKKGKRSMKNGYVRIPSDESEDDEEAYVW